jgi:hypothetical protein
MSQLHPKGRGDPARVMAGGARPFPIQGRVKGIGLEDPVFAAAFERMPALSDLDNGGAVTSDEYFAERLALLAHVPLVNPRFSKLAFGRLAWFPLHSEPWDRLSAWAVFFARRLQLARQPDLLALPFLMLNRPEEEAFHCETSDKDNLWAVETPVPQGAESPLDVLLPAYGDDAAAEAFWARLRAEAPSRKLGEANARVARSLLLSATDAQLLEGEPRPPPSSSPRAGSSGSTAASPARARSSARRASPPRSSHTCARRRCARCSRPSPRASPRARPSLLREVKNRALFVCDEDDEMNKVRAPCFGFMQFNPKYKGRAARAAASQWPRALRRPTTGGEGAPPASQKRRAARTARARKLRHTLRC